MDMTWQDVCGLKIYLNDMKMKRKTLNLYKWYEHHNVCIYIYIYIWSDVFCFNMIFSTLDFDLSFGMEYSCWTCFLFKMYKAIHPLKFNSSPLKIDDSKTSFLLGVCLFLGASCGISGVCQVLGSYSQFCSCLLDQDVLFHDWSTYPPLSFPPEKQGVNSRPY